ncbi:MAG: hypothetical protein QME42_01240 [bacterium]|nr:hypothetical protein [bacterium]
MYKAEVYLEDTQHETLRDIAYVMTKHNKKRVSLSELVRRAVTLWIEMEGKEILKGSNQK